MKRILFSTAMLSALLIAACDTYCNSAPEFEEYTFEDSVEGKYSVDIRYQHIANSHECDILARIEQANYDHFFEEAAVEPADIEASMHDMARRFSDDILSYEYSTDCYFDIDQAAFTTRDNSILCYETHVDIYAGGAHGGQSLWYECYSLETGQPYDFGYLYDGEWAAAINELLYDKLTEVVTADGLLINDHKELPVADSVLITDSGLVFVYQPYSVASYAEGILSVEISDADLAATKVPMLWGER
ncbi:MAG: DUF3298 domain-containing protein [Alistipes sp.]|nr:DUF3298 domain-containing protein [Alistipes sp.]